jgi:hypothetical protein
MVAVAFAGCGGASPGEQAVSTLEQQRHEREQAKASASQPATSDKPDPERTTQSAPQGPPTDHPATQQGASSASGHGEGSIARAGDVAVHVDRLKDPKPGKQKPRKR